MKTTKTVSRISKPKPVAPATTALTLMPRRIPAPYAGLCSQAWRWLQSKKAARCADARLHVVENVSLGEKRFVAVVNVDGKRFLIGGSSGNVSLLTQLEANEPFAKVLSKSAAKRSPAARQKAKAA